MRAWLLVLSIMMLLGCASSLTNLQRETARVLGHQLHPSSVEVSNIDRRMTSVTWTATAQGRSYLCHADQMVQRPYCVEGRR
jgi:uncharacterized protein YcfL